MDGDSTLAAMGPSTDAHLQRIAVAEDAPPKGPIR